LLLATFFVGCQRNSPDQYQGESLRHWEIQATDHDPAKRREAVQALGKIGLKGLPGLTKLLDDSDQQVRNAATLAIIRLGRPALPELKRLTKSPNEKVRNGANQALIRLLVDMGHDGVPQLIELLKSPEPNLRLTAASALMRIRPDQSKSAIPALEEMLDEETNPGVRRTASMTLKYLKTEKNAQEKLHGQATPQR
jgi:HEAT repeat protein